MNNKVTIMTNYMMSLSNDQTVSAICQIQKIYSSIFYINFQFRYRSKTVNFFLNRGKKPLPRFFYSKVKTPSNLRINDNFLELLRKNLKNKFIEKVQYSDKTRVLSLFSSDKNFKSVHFFWNQRGLKYIFVFDKKIFKSWEKRYLNSDFSYDDLSQYFNTNEVLTDNYPSNLELLNVYPDFEENFLSKNSKKLLKKNNQKCLRKIENIKNDLLKIQNYNKLFDLCMSDKLDLNSEKLLFHGVSIKFKRSDNFYQKKDKVFKKIKALRIAEKIQLNRLNQSINDLEKIVQDKDQEFNLKDYENYRKFIVYPLQDKKLEKIKSSSVKNKNIKKFTYAGLDGYFGENESGNERIIKEIANKSDIWFHLENRPSSHLIIKTTNFFQIDETLLSLIGSILIDKELLNSESVNLVYCHVKDLKKLKGSKALVSSKKFKYISVKYNVNWRNILLQLTK